MSFLRIPTVPASFGEYGQGPESRLSPAESSAASTVVITITPHRINMRDLYEVLFRSPERYHFRDRPLFLSLLLSPRQHYPCTTTASPFADQCEYRTRQAGSRCRRVEAQGDENTLASFRLRLAFCLCLRVIGIGVRR